MKTTDKYLMNIMQKLNKILAMNPTMYRKNCTP